jgi:hypothetical protein
MSPLGSKPSTRTAAASPSPVTAMTPSGEAAAGGGRSPAPAGRPPRSPGMHGDGGRSMSDEAAALSAAAEAGAAESQGRWWLVSEPLAALAAYAAHAANGRLTGLDVQVKRIKVPDDLAAAKTTLAPFLQRGTKVVLAADPAARERGGDSMRVDAGNNKLIITGGPLWWCRVMVALDSPQHRGKVSPRGWK